MRRPAQTRIKLGALLGADPRVYEPVADVQITPRLTDAKPRQTHRQIHGQQAGNIHSNIIIAAYYGVNAKRGGKRMALREFYLYLP